MAIRLLTALAGIFAISQSSNVTPSLATKVDGAARRTRNDREEFAERFRDDNHGCAPFILKSITSFDGSSKFKVIIEGEKITIFEKKGLWRNTFNSLKDLENEITFRSFLSSESLHQKGSDYLMVLTGALGAVVESQWEKLKFEEGDFYGRCEPDPILRINVPSSRFEVYFEGSAAVIKEGKNTMRFYYIAEINDMIDRLNRESSLNDRNTDFLNVLKVLESYWTYH